MSSIAFDALLDSLRAAHGNRAVRRSAAREGQVFEPTPTDPREHRLKTISDRQRAQDNRADVGALRQSRNDTRIDGNQRVNRDAAASQNEEKVAAKTARTSGSHGRTLAESLTQSRTGADHSVGTNKLTPSSVEGRPSPPRTAAFVEQAPMRGGVDASSAPARVDSPPAGDREQSLARQIARVLGAPRGGETIESKASSAPPAGPSVGPGGSASSRHSGRTHGAASPSKQAPTPGEAGPGATGKSEFERLVRSIHMQAGKSRSSVTMQLNPPKLGRMRVEARLDGAFLTLSVRTQSTQARDLIQERLADLQLSLQKHGIQIERFDVQEFVPDRPGGDAQDNHLGREFDHSRSQPGRGGTAPPGERSADETSTTVEASIPVGPSEDGGLELDIRI